MTFDAIWEVVYNAISSYRDTIMSKVNADPGARFERIVIIRTLSKSEGGDRTRTEYKCDCGKVKIASKSDIARGRIKSCGCLRKELLAERSSTHNKSKIPEYAVWAAMIQRCVNEKDKAYKNYGGRGVTVCDEWKDSFANFHKDMGPRPSSRHTIDRTNNDGNYEKSNCRWATRKEQAANTRANVNITYNGETKCISEWARYTGVHASSFCERLEKYGIEAAITGEWEGKQRRNKTYEFNGKTQTITEWAKEIGVGRDTLKCRLGTYGMSIERALTMKKRERD